MTKNDCFEGLYEEHGNYILRIAVKKTKDYQAAQDIQQQVFCEFYANMYKIRPGQEKAWLYRCTEHAVIDYWRNRQRKQDKRVYFEDIPVEMGNLLVNPYAISFEDAIVRQELITRILDELKAVNWQWYEAVVLCCVEELSYREAAEILDISGDVVRMRICRARAYIRGKFRDEYK